MRPTSLQVDGMSRCAKGSAVTYWFLCNRPELLASTGQISGATADQVTVAATGKACISSIDANWKPRVPMLAINGTADQQLPIDAAHERNQGIIMRLGLTGGDQVDSGPDFTRKRWQGDDGMVFDFIEHDLESFLPILAGHCIPGGPESDMYACGPGGGQLHWGKTVLQWFIDHPKP